jgi:hypothetical protein
MGRLLLFDPQAITHIDDLDRWLSVPGNDAVVGARCESIHDTYPDGVSRWVRSAGGSAAGVEYRETRCAAGYVYHQFYQWNMQRAPHSWERRCGFLPLLISETPLEGIQGEEGAAA